MPTLVFEMATTTTTAMPAMAHFVEQHLTPDNVAKGITGLLAFAGFLHALPGPTLKMQAKEMKMPAWFICCAGLLMLGSAGLYHFRPLEGLYAVVLCLGGTTATAFKLPAVGGIVFSTLTLGAALWIEKEALMNGPLAGRLFVGVTLSATYLAGVAGRLYVPGNANLAKVFGCSEKKDESKKVVTPVATKPDVPKKVGLETSPAKGGSARKRTESPAYRRGVDATA